MRISVVVPSFNQAKYLSATLDSLLDQHYPDLEVLIFDGGSTDGSVDVLRSHPGKFRWVSGPDGGQTFAINRGLRQATGDVLAYLNSDDVYRPGALAAVAAHLSQNPDCQILYGDAYHIGPDGKVLEAYYCEPWNFTRLHEVCFICQPAVFWRREVVDSFGIFDDRLHFAMDYDYWLRVGRHVSFDYLKGNFLAGSRLHQDTKTLRQRVACHREILNVVVNQACSLKGQLTWLEHLSHHEANELSISDCLDAHLHRNIVITFVAKVLENSARTGIRLPEDKLIEYAGLLDEVGA